MMVASVSSRPSVASSTGGTFNEEDLVTSNCCVVVGLIFEKCYEFNRNKTICVTPWW
jgi:hypothetical protein